jgi:pilus assembly protein CpaF
MAIAELSNAELDELKQAVRSRLAWDAAISDGELRKRIEEELFVRDRCKGLTAASRKAAVERLFHSFRGLDALQPLLEDADITEIMINRHDQIYYEKHGKLFRSPIAFESGEKLEDLIQGIVGRVNRIVNESNPIADARLPDGSRVHIVLPPIALNGPTVTIRRFPRQPMGMQDLLAAGALSEEAATLLRQLIVARYNLFISGGTGSGKTTLLGALSEWIPPGERIVTIEDAAELRLRGADNLVSLETRNANSEGKGKITTADLIRASLRMRPNRIIVGEVRGAEALDMLQAMNTGHEGSLSTGHANSPQDMLSRLETMVLSGAEMPLSAVRHMIASALDIIIHVSRFRDGTRKVKEICEVLGVINGEIRLQTLYRFGMTGEHGGQVVGRLEKVGDLTHTQKLQFAGWEPNG